MNPGKDRVHAHPIAEDEQENGEDPIVFTTGVGRVAVRLAFAFQQLLQVRYPHLH